MKSPPLRTVRAKPNCAIRPFVAAQWAQGTQSATALAKFAARVASGVGPLSKLARRRQDLANTIRELDRAHLSAMVDGQRERSEAARRKRIDEFTVKLQAARGKLAGLDQRLRKEFSGIRGSDPTSSALVDIRTKTSSTR